MRQFSIVFIVLIILCTLISCSLPSSSSTLKSEKTEKIDIVPVDIHDSNIYTTEIQGYFETPHYAVFAIVHYVTGGHLGYAQSEFPLEVHETTFGGYPVYNAGDTINVKMTDHRKRLERSEILVLETLVAYLHTKVVFIGFCTEGTYKLNVNGFEREFSVGNIK